MDAKSPRARALYDSKELPLPPDTPVDASILRELGFKYSPAPTGPPYWPYTYKPWDCARLAQTGVGVVDLFKPPGGGTSIPLYRPLPPGSRRISWPPMPMAGRAGGSEIPSPTSIPRLRVDTAIIGGGIAGLAAAEALVEHGASIAIVDFGSEPGGYLGGLWSPSELDPSRSSAELASAIHAKLATISGVRILQGWEFIRPSRRGALILRGPEGYLLLEAKSVIVASGGIDQRPVFPGNWLPGIVASDYALRLMSWYNLRFRSVAIVGWGEWALRLAGQVAAKYADRVVIVSKKKLPGNLRYMDYASQFGVELVVDKIVGAEATSEGIRLRFREYEDLLFDVIISAIGPYPEPLTPAMLGASLVYSEALKALIPRAKEDSSTSRGVFVAGLSAGEASEYAAYHGGRLAGRAAAAYLGLADESDVRMEIQSLTRDPLVADIMVELRQGPQAAPPSEPDAFMGPGIARGEYIDVCAGIEVGALDSSLRRFRDLGVTIDELGLFTGLDQGREALQALVQFASMILGVQPSQLPLGDLPRPLSASPISLAEIALGDQA